MVVSHNQGNFFWGVPIIRTIVYWSIYWGTLILGNYDAEQLVLNGFLNSLVI